MISPVPSHHGYRFPSDIIAYAVWLYFRFNLSFRDVEDLLAQRGITVTYETIRRWCRTFTVRILAGSGAWATRGISISCSSP